MTTPDPGRAPAPGAVRKPGRATMAYLLAFHASLSGAFLVAYLSGDEATYGMHVFAGYTVLAALASRLVVGLAAPAGSPLRLPRPDPAATRAWLLRLVRGETRARTQRSPLLPWMAVLLLAGVGAAAVTGALADAILWLEGLHEALAEATPALVLAHIGLVLGLRVLKEPSSLQAVLRLLPFPRSVSPTR